MAFKPVKIPGPPLSPIHGWQGNLFENYKDPILHAQMLYKNYGKIAAWIKDSPFIISVFGPENNQFVLTKPDLFHNNSSTLSTSKNSSAFRLSDNLLTNEGEKHAKQKRLITPLLTKKYIEIYHYDMVNITNDFIIDWASGQKKDFAHEMKILSMKLALKCLFGLESSDEIELIENLFKKVGEISANAVTEPNNSGTAINKLFKLAEELENEMKAIIKKRRESPPQTKNLLSSLMDAVDEEKNKFTDNELAGQTYLLFVAGHETVSSSLTWTMFLLAQHPKVMKKLIDELESNLKGAPPSVSILDKLTYLEYIIKESWRILAPISFFGRKSTRNFSLGGYDIPGGASIVISPHITHHMPEIYYQPESFIPERWENNTPGTFEYLPFGFGTHICVGSAFAMMEMKIILATILQRFRLKVTPGSRIDQQFRVTIFPKSGMPMLINNQDYNFSSSQVYGNINQIVDLQL